MLVLVLGLVWPATTFGAQFAVDSTADAPDAQPDDGVCRTVAGNCTLRAAIQSANATPGANTVILPAGTFRITRPGKPLLTQSAVFGANPDDGFLQITGAVTVRGAGAPQTSVDGGRLDRVFGVQDDATAMLTDVTITGGDATAPASDSDIALGGGILNFGRLTLERVALVRNHADGGGGMFTAPGGTFAIHDSLIANNTAVEGGGVRADTGGEIVNTTITGNVLRYRPPAELLPDEVTGYGGGIDHRGGADLTIVNTTITGNHAYKAGGGLNSGQDYAPIVPASSWPYRVYLHNTIIAGNTADQTPGNCHVSAMVIESRGHNLADDATCSLTAEGDLPGRDPRLGPLADNGGPTSTQALLPSSPAIDAGSRDACPATDQRGVNRADACDIGAFEHIAPKRRRCRTAITVRIAGLRNARIHAVEATVNGRRAHVRRLPRRRVVVTLPRNRAAKHRIRLTIHYTLHRKKLTRHQARTVRACPLRSR